MLEQIETYAAKRTDFAVVRRRFHKGIENFLTQYRMVADSWMLFDNSEAVPRLIAEQKTGRTTVLDQPLYSRITTWMEGL